MFKKESVLFTQSFFEVDDRLLRTQLMAGCAFPRFVFTAILKINNGDVYSNYNLLGFQVENLEYT